jgi:hypothetical protein
MVAHWRVTMPAGFGERHQMMRDIVTVFPPGHPDATTLREMLTHLDQFDVLQRELPFTPAANHDGGTKA